MLDKINEVKIGRKEKVITNLENFYKSREEVFNFFRDYAKIMLDSEYKTKQDENKGTGLPITSEIAKSSCTSKSRQQFRKFIKRDQGNCLFFVSIKKKSLKKYITT